MSTSKKGRKPHSKEQTLLEYGNPLGSPWSKLWRPLLENVLPQRAGSFGLAAVVFPHAKSHSGAEMDTWFLM